MLYFCVIYVCGLDLIIYFGYFVFKKIDIFFMNCKYKIIVIN